MASLGTPPGLIRFGPFALDPTNRELRKRGYLVRLQPQQFAVLLLLTERAGQIVSAASSALYDHDLASHGTGLIRNESPTRGA